MNIKQTVEDTSKFTVSQNLGFDIRIVRYEEIHNISSADFSILENIVDINNNEKILDVGAGYGAVTRELIKRNKNKNTEYFLTELSNVQLQRAKVELPKHFGEDVTNKYVKFSMDNIVNSQLIDNYFEKVVAKMVIHEIKQEYQQYAINQIYRILKPNGKFIIWDIILDEGIQTLYQSIIRKKDKLAGFEDLASNRYFFRKTDLEQMLQNAGFKNIKQEVFLPYKLNTHKRLETELKNDKIKLSEWNNFIREEVNKLPGEIKTKISYCDEGENISLIFPKAIYSAYKK